MKTWTSCTFIPASIIKECFLSTHGCSLYYYLLFTLANYKLSEILHNLSLHYIMLKEMSLLRIFTLGSGDISQAPYNIVPFLGSRRPCLHLLTPCS